MTTPTTCSYCGATFTEANPANKFGLCRDAEACMDRKWSEEAEGGNE